MSSYKYIVKTTGLIGIVQVFQMAFGLLRNKVLAVLVGAQGFGVWGLYHSYVEMMTQLSVLGLDQSGVRQIAKYSDDKEYVSKCIFLFRWAIFSISILSTTISIIFSKSISMSLFKTEEYSWGVVIVSFVILFNSISKGQKSILNGLREIRALAISQIIGAVVGSIISVILVFLLGVRGIPFYILSVGLSSVFSTWWFVSKLKLKKVIPSRVEGKRELKDLFALGMGFSIAGIIASVMTYISRVYLTNTFSVETIGIYQAGWTISNLYVGTILSAMGIDLMPRLMRVVKNDKEMGRMINEQIELGMLIASIGVVGIINFAPIFISLLFSEEFVKGVTIIRWQVLGVSLRVLAYPLSYAIMAKKKTITYIIVQSIFWVLEFIFLMILTTVFGFKALGVNFFLGYMLYFFICWNVCRKLINFKPTRLAKEIIIISYLFIIGSLLISLNLSKIFSYIIGTAIITVNMCWILFTLEKRMKINIKDSLKRLTRQRHL